MTGVRPSPWQPPDRAGHVVCRDAADFGGTPEPPSVAANNRQVRSSAWADTGVPVDPRVPIEWRSDVFTSQPGQRVRGD